MGCGCGSRRLRTQALWRLTTKTPCLAAGGGREFVFCPGVFSRTMSLLRRAAHCTKTSCVSTRLLLSYETSGARFEACASWVADVVLSSLSHYGVGFYLACKHGAVVKSTRTSDVMYRLSAWGPDRRFPSCLSRRMPVCWCIFCLLLAVMFKRVCLSGSDVRAVCFSGDFPCRFPWVSVAPRVPLVKPVLICF